MNDWVTSGASKIQMPLKSESLSSSKLVTSVVVFKIQKYPRDELEL